MQKAAYLGRVLERWADRLEPVRGPAEAFRRSGYRERVTLTARWDVVGGWCFGLVRRDELIAIHDCPVHHPRVNALVQLLRAFLPPAGDLPLAYLHVTGTQATLIVKARDVAREQLAGLSSHVGEAGFEGLWLHRHPAAGRRLFARSGWDLLWGQARSIDRDGLAHGPTAFRQPLPELHAAAIESAARHLDAVGTRPVLDLYCGTGATLRRWTRSGAAALGVELGGEAVACATSNAPAATVLRGTCLQRLPQVRAWWRAQATTPVAYVNPPRSGLEGDVAKTLAAELVPPRLAYLSCSAGTLARDLQVFAHAGYRVGGLLPFDFFPGTHHVECLALLER